MLLGLSGGLALGLAAFAQEPKPAGAPQAVTPEVLPELPPEELPPEEDKSRMPKEYSFNPVQANKELTVGEFYFRKGDFRAAALRFGEATKWNPGNATAWLRLGEALEKNHAPKDARGAYLKYLEAAPEAKDRIDVRKRIDRIKP